MPLKYMWTRKVLLDARRETPLWEKIGLVVVWAYFLGHFIAWAIRGFPILGK